MSLFLMDTHTKKLDLLRSLLLHDNSLTTAELANKWEVSTKTIIRHAQSLDDDCREMSGSSRYRVIISQGKLTLTMSEDSVPSYLMEYLTSFYAQESVKVRIMSALLKKSHASVTELADSLYLTPNTLYKHLYQLESVLTPFDLTFNWQKQSHSLNFSYDEKKMRYFSYLFYWRFYRGLFPIEKGETIESDSSLEEEIAHLFPSGTSLVKQKQFLYLTEVTQWHLEQSDSITLSDTASDILQIIVSIKDYSGILSENQEKELPNTEQLFFNFLVRISIPSLDDDVSKQHIVTALSDQHSLLFQYCQDLHDHLIIHFELSPTTKSTIDFYYYMILFTLHNLELSVPFNNDFLKEISLNFYKNEHLLSDEVLAKINSLFRLVTQRHGYSCENDYTAYLIIWLFLSANQPTRPLIIAIHFSDNPIGDTIIKTRLLQIFNPNQLHFTEQMKTADLIISDCTQLEKSSQAFFYMEYLTDSFYWDRLLTVIQRKLTTYFV
ncbi:helix-turn-helix domain-containing protein [Vagococcus sp. BWB3-3]|uniref:Helix-turn-helix domain-containing protein n=1 Tax=Vagococcus allomyrinae TaxID=2794353 RepID=A0A940PG50_9ENTE|nr:helix-turn-helix domain-containing protein [Vagococcus allomyrinae]MBP1044244.1 helix-turn-helix domain-containing protein [Vagococcus allomyrinae]